MNDILNADIFFVIASISTVLFTLVLCAILYQILKLVKTLRRIIERVESASEQVAADMVQARALLYNGGIIAKVIGFMAGTKRKTRRSRDED